MYQRDQMIKLAATRECSFSGHENVRQYKIFTYIHHTKQCTIYISSFPITVDLFTNKEEN